MNPEPRTPDLEPAVPRDPERLIDKAAVNNYRPIARTAYARCFNCANRESVPLYWCDHAGRQVDLDHTCDMFKGIHNGGK